MEIIAAIYLPGVLVLLEVPCFLGFVAEEIVSCLGAGCFGLTSGTSLATSAAAIYQYKSVSRFKTYM